MPHSGFYAVSLLLPSYLSIKPHVMTDRYGEDVVQALGAAMPRLVGRTRLLVWTNRNTDLCRKDEARKVLQDAEEVFMRASMLTLDWRFQTVWYKAVADRVAGLHVPSSPIGGIFFHRTVDKVLVISLQWEMLKKIAPILEFILECRIDRDLLGAALPCSPDSLPPSDFLVVAEGQDLTKGTTTTSFEGDK